LNVVELGRLADAPAPSTVRAFAESLAGGFDNALGG
jgi:hypothetical protein